MEYRKSITKITYHNDKIQALLKEMDIKNIGNIKMKGQLNALQKQTNIFASYTNHLIGKSSEVFGEMFDELDKELDKMLSEIID